MSYVTLNQVISGRIYDGEWRDMTEEERIKYLEEIKEVLRGLCRWNNSKIMDAINRMSLTNLPRHYGILDRLTNKEYMAGQYYPGEIATVKQIIREEC